MIANTVESNIFLLTFCLGIVYVSGEEARIIISFELTVTLTSATAFVITVFIGGRRWMGVILILGYMAFFVLEFTFFRRETESVFPKSISVNL